MKSIIVILAYVGFLIPNFVHAKCKGWEAGQPNFCVSLTTGQVSSSGNNDCIYKVIVDSYSDSKPKLEEFEFHKNILNTKKDYLVRFSKKSCLDMKSGDKKTGVIAANCFDNESKWDKFRDWIGLPKDRPEYSFLESGDTVWHYKGSAAVSCP